jgi:uncharacterized Zn finger protein
MPAQKKMATRKKPVAKKKPVKKAADPLTRLTWDEVEEWAGSKIVSRGRNYQRNGVVEGLVRTADGSLLAWVQGTHQYATQVSISGRKTLKLESRCNCPYGSTCKHAVAVVLEYLEGVKEKRKVEQVGEDDPRLKALEEGIEDADEWDDFEEFDDEDYEPVRQKSGKKRGKKAELNTYLHKFTKAELVALVEELAAEFSEVNQRLEDRQTLSSGQTRKMVKAVQTEIDNIADPWDGDYRYREDAADLGRVEEHLKALVAAGQADAVVKLGEDLIDAAGQAVETYDHDGDIAYEIEPCQEIIFQALKQSSLSPSEQLEWAVDMKLGDDYGMGGSAQEKFWKSRFPKDAWSGLVDLLRKRLDDLEVPEDSDSFSSQYGRNKLSDWVITALEKAGRRDEVIPLCEREAPITQSYGRLVDALIAAKRWEEARRWCKAGLEVAGKEHRGTEQTLREKLRVINGKVSGPKHGVAILAEEFFANPGLRTFEELGKGARKVRVGPAVDAWARYYLKTGQRPEPAGEKRGQRSTGAPEADWPLPAADIEIEPQFGLPDAPMCEALLEIALHEEKPDEVVEWYDYSQRQERSGYWLRTSDTTVAEAVKEAYPDRAIAIWKEEAEGQIALTKVEAYRTAGEYLKKVRDVLVKKRRKKEWDGYLADLRQQNLRKPRCVEVLDRLAGVPRRIIDG